MTEYLQLADIRVLLGLNHAVAAHPALYKLALFLTDTGADLLLLATAAWLWFWPERAARTPGAPPTAPRSRQESRARLLVIGIAGVCAYIVARLAAIELDKDRPFVTYLPVMGLPGSFEGLRTFGTFPSDHAALLGALPVAFAHWSERLGWAWAALAGLFTTARIAVGFHYPSDMVAGLLLGVLAAVAAMWIYDRLALPRRWANLVAAGFSRRPYAYFLYLLLALVGVEFALHFKHVLGLLVSLRYQLA